MILLTIDTSPASEAALPAAVRLARRFEEPLRILLVLDGPVRHHVDQLARERGSDLEAVAAELVDGVVATARAEGVEAEGVHRHAADAGPGIVEAASDPGVALLVMATHGRSGISRFLSGSVTEYVIRHSPVPTVVVPATRD